MGGGRGRARSGRGKREGRGKARSGRGREREGWSRHVKQRSLAANTCTVKGCSVVVESGVWLTSILSDIIGRESDAMKIL